MKKVLKSNIFIVCISFLIFLFHHSSLHGQVKKDKSPKEDNWFVGGGIGLQFGTQTIIEVSPYVGYWLTSRAGIGIGGSYQYYNYKDKFYRFSTNVFGGRIFGRYLIIDEIFAHAEYEVLSYQSDLLYQIYMIPNQGRFNIESVLLGGGYRQQIGNSSYANLLVLWNINEQTFTPYSNPVFRMGIEFNF